MANQTTSSQQLQSIRNEFIVNGIDMFENFGFDDGALDSSVFASPYIDSTSGDDPEPVRFMQTEVQKQRHRQNQEKRRLLQAIRRLRRARREKAQTITLPTGSVRKVWRGGLQRRKRQIKDPFKNLPCDVLLDIMRQTRCGDFEDLMEVSPAAEDVYSENESACIRGIEINQYSQLKWLFGDSRHRTAEQKQAFKDWIGTYYYVSKQEDTVVEDFGRIDDDKLVGPLSLKYPLRVQESLGDFIESLKDTTGIEMTSRTALCMQALSMKRAQLVAWVAFDGVRGHHKTRRVILSEMPSEDRISFFNGQPVTTQDEIRRIFENIITYIARESMDLSMADWVRDYYDQRGNNNSKELKEMGAWLTSLGVGLVMQVVLEHPGETMDTWMDMCFRRAGSSNLESVMALEMELEGQGEEQVKVGMEFAEAVGLDTKKVLAGTAVEDTLSELRKEEAERLEGESNDESVFGDPGTLL